MYRRLIRFPGRRHLSPLFLSILTCAAVLLALGTSAEARTRGTQLWVARYHPVNSHDRASAVAVSPDGSRVFVTGTRLGSTSSYDYATVAYNALTGVKLWAAGYDGPVNGGDYAISLAVSPDGSKVFVTGYSDGPHGRDYATLAYSTSTGTVLWLRRYNGPANGGDYATSVAVSPDGRRVFVTGHSEPPSGDFSNFATLAYDASTGARLWVRRYAGPQNLSVATSLVVSPNGSSVFVTGSSYGTTDGVSSLDYATVAYNASTGATLWVRRFNGAGNGNDFAHSVAISPDGSKVFVTGSSSGTTNGVTSADYATVAYDGSTGARLWVRRYDGPANGEDDATAVATSPDGSELFVTGTSSGTTSVSDYATAAYSASTGRKLWVKRYNGPGASTDSAAAVASNPDGSEVFVTGTSIVATTGYDYATVAYTARTGSTRWVARYNDRGNGEDAATSLAPSPDGSRVFVTGQSHVAYGTVAYAA